ncbi:MAG TPA: hypothetical protein VD886_24935 [Herpetosiphonaceae bacterium]|nr:hypothetical protein [Herpetosiphonaceae bacterium]
MSGSRRGRRPTGWLALAVVGVALITLFDPGLFERLPERFGSYVMVAVALAASVAWLMRRRG